MERIRYHYESWKRDHGSQLMNYRFILRRLGGSPLSIVGICIILSLVAAAVFAPWIVPYPDHVRLGIDQENALQPPSLKHLFGTDDLGRDVFSRVLYGSRLSLRIGLIVVGLTALIGVPLGAIAGYLGGTADEIIMRVADTFMAIPYVLITVAIVSALGPSIINVMLAISIPWWPWYARVVRGEVLRLKEESFIEASRSLGASKGRIIFLHLLPNCIGLVIVQATIQIGQAILAAASMGFLGVGAQPPEVEWGLMISIGRNYMPTWWWMAVFPGAAIFTTVLGFNLLGDALRDILDPRYRR